MDTSVISPQTVELISRLTGQKLHQQDVTPPVLFLAALITVLLGVIHADGTLSAEETQQLRNLMELIPANHSLRQLIMPIVDGVEEQQIYKKIQVLLAMTACFSEEEKLLLISFGYQMSAADGTIDDRETGYLTLIGNRLEIDSRYLAVLSASFNNQTISDTAALAEVHSLLDPAQFQSLDSLFVRAASHIIEDLPAKPQYKKSQLDSVQIIEDLPAKLKQEINQLNSVQIIADLPTEPKQPNNQNHSVSSYQELEKFQKYRQELNAVCSRLYLTLRDGSDRNVLSPSLTAEVEKESCKLQSQRFRVVVVGDFSRGKSTLLNALVGEKIQPVRATPCSGTVTILKYGSKRRVICHYKNGCKEEISPEEYQKKASISRNAASGSIADEKATSEIAEIVFEHPELELCSNGVEIIDTPGLNEQAERTLATQQVLQTADAVIFLTQATTALTQTEQELLLYLKKELNYGEENEGARNIFIAVSFFDWLESEEDRQDVKKRVERIVYGEKPIIAGKNRIHFISAKSALNAILNGTENEYVRSFQNFTKSLEQFLIEKRGAIALQESAAGLKQIIDTGCEELNQYQKMLDGKLTLPEADKQKIFEQIAEVSGRDVTIRLLAKKLREECLEEIRESWNECKKGLRERIISQSANWTSEHSHLWSQDKLTRDYANQFVRDLTQDIDNWANQKLWSIVKKYIQFLDGKISENMEPIREEFELFDKRLNTNLFIQFNNFATAGKLGEFSSIGSRIAASISNIGVDVGGFMGSTLGIGAAVGAALFYLTGVGTIAVILGALVAAAGGGVGWGLLEGDVVKAQIKQKVRELGFPKFEESSQSIFIENIQEKIIAAFEKRTEATSDVMKQISRKYLNKWRK
ncbi:MAG: dynamin family protein [Microcoleus sp.]